MFFKFVQLPKNPPFVEQRTGEQNQHSPQMRIDFRHRGQHGCQLLAVHWSPPRSSSLRRRRGLHPQCCSCYSLPSAWKQVAGYPRFAMRKLSPLQYLGRLGMYKTSAPNNHLTVSCAISSGLQLWGPIERWRNIETNLTACMGTVPAWRAVIRAWTWKWAKWTTVWAIRTPTILYVPKLGKTFLEVGNRFHP